MAAGKTFGSVLRISLENNQMNAQSMLPVTTGWGQQSISEQHLPIADSPGALHHVQLLKPCPWIADSGMQFPTTVKKPSMFSKLNWMRTRNETYNEELYRTQQFCGYTQDSIYYQLGRTATIRALHSADFSREKSQFCFCSLSALCS